MSAHASTRWPWRVGALVSLLVCGLSIGSAPAEVAVEVPALAAVGDAMQDPGAFTIKVLWWDKKPEPNPVVLKWGGGFINAIEYGRVTPGRSARSSAINAFRYAIQHTPSARHTGTVNIQGVAYGSTSMDGSSAGAVMAVGFMALFNEHKIQKGIAMTGTLKPDGRVGRVGGIPGKVRAAAREGYHTVLIPEGQLSETQWDLKTLAIQLDVKVKEVRAIDQAYELMTGHTL